MLPQTTGEAEAEAGNPTSSDDSSLHMMADLNTALRISISGENIELNSEKPMTYVGTMFERMSEFDLSVPEDMPVDLRVKLAVAMIHNGKKFPDVNQNTAITSIHNNMYLGV